MATLTAQPILSSLTASKPVFTDASKGLVSTGTLGADQGGTGIANNAAMTVTGSGNFAYTRTLTGITNVTLPTTGTLATLAGTETFTNKTLTSPTINSPTIGGTPVMGASVITQGTAVASTSGTSIDFTSIPSWVKRITIQFQGVSTNGTSTIQLQLGTGSTTYTTTGYLGVGLSAAATISATNGTTGFGVGSGNQAAATVMHGQIVITNVTGNNWVGTGMFGMSNTITMHFTAASISLAAALTAVRTTTVNGTDTFDAGSINILYE